MGGRACGAEDVALLGTARDEEIASRVHRSVDPVAVKRQTLDISNFELGQSAAAEYAGVCTSTINNWYAAGWVEPIDSTQRSRRCTKAALDRAKKIAEEKGAEHRSTQFKTNFLNGKAHRPKPPCGRWGCIAISKEAKRRGLKLAPVTVRKHFKRGWLKHDGPDDSECYYCRRKTARKYLGRLPKLRTAARKSAEQSRLASIRKKAENGGLSTRRAAVRANVAVDTMCSAIHRGDLKPIDDKQNRPWRFAELAVDEWAGRHLRRQPDDVLLQEIPARIPTDPRSRAADSEAGVLRCRPGDRRDIRPTLCDVSRYRTINAVYS